MTSNFAPLLCMKNLKNLEGSGSYLEASIQDQLSYLTICLCITYIFIILCFTQGDASITTSDIDLQFVPQGLAEQTLQGRFLQFYTQFPPVAVNHEYDTCFKNGLVMGYADCKYFAGSVETSKVVSNVSLTLCQTHCKQVPVFSRLSKSH